MGIWKDLFLGVCDKHAPHTKIRVRGEKTEWMTDEYIGMTYERDDLKQKVEKGKDPELWTKYKDMRNKVNNYKEQLKKEYYQEKILEHKDNSSKLWKVMKDMMSCKSKHDPIKSLSVDGERVVNQLKLLQNSILFS